MQAVNKYLIITPIVEEMKTESGLLMTSNDTSQIRYKKGVVVSAGVNVDAIKDGDTIYTTMVMLVTRCC